MTEAEFNDLITTRKAQTVLDQLARLTHADRRKLAKTAMRTYRLYDKVQFSPNGKDTLRVKDPEALIVAVLGTATASELTAMSFLPTPRSVAITDIFRRLELDWAQAVADHFVEQRTFYIDRLAPLWMEGLCQRPDSDAIILGYYSIWGTLSLDEDSLLAGDVWRFFEVEGGGEFSLANHDKFVKPGRGSWSDRLIKLADSGKLDRQRLLDASLDALDRDFGQYAAGWYSRFHIALAPDTAERVARKDRYLRLLGASVPPTVSFALKQVQALDKTGAYAPDDLLDALDPALQARAKGTVKAALKLVARTARREPACRQVAAEKAMLALVAEEADVQEASLDVIGTLAMDGPALRDALAGYVDLVQPSVRTRIAQMAGVSAPPAPTAEPPHQSVRAVPVEAADTPDAALAIVLSALENPRDPIAVERAADAISRFGAILIQDATALSPLKKRANQIWKAPGDTDARTILALTSKALCESADMATILKAESGKTLFHVVEERSLQGVHIARNAEMVSRVLAGHALPLLSLPSDTSGAVMAKDLLDRLAAYRGAGVAPSETDASLALMRLSADNRPGASGLATDTEVDRAVAYALGADGMLEAPGLMARVRGKGPAPGLWAAAWTARGTQTEDARIVSLFPAPSAGCGTPARMTLSVDPSDSGTGWLSLNVVSEPGPHSQVSAIPALFHLRQKKYFAASTCGHSYADIAWAGLTCPADPEPFYRVGLLNIDTWQKLADNPTRAYLEPFFRPGPKVGPMGAALLSSYMACEDKSVSSLAVEAIATTAADGRLSAEMFADGWRPCLLSGSLPTTRWTKTLTAVAQTGASDFVRDAITAILDFHAKDTPRDMGGLLELLFELHTAAGTATKAQKALDCLRAMPGGGKVAKFTKKLLAQAEAA